MRAPELEAVTPEAPAETTNRPRLWLELVWVVWLLWIYDAVNNLAPLRRKAALRHSRGILHFEQRFHLDPEAALDRWLSHHHTLAVVLSNYYDNAHFVVTFSMVVLLWWKRPWLYRPLRTGLILTNVIAMTVFWFYPTAPPRLLDPARFPDIVSQTHAFGSWHSGTLATAANQFAAMPSLHIAWASWSALAAWRMLGRRRGALLVWLYPVITGLAVLSTGNHFFFDALGGIATFGISMLIADQWARHFPSGRWKRTAPCAFTTVEAVVEQGVTS